MKKRPKKSEVHVYRPTTVDEVKVLLDEAKAPKLKARADFIPELASSIDIIAELRAGIPVSPEVQLRRRAKTAVDDLRLLLPQLAWLSLQNASRPSLLSTTTKEDHLRQHYEQAFLEAQIAMLLHKYDPKFTPKRLARFATADDDAMQLSWHMPAAMVWLTYRNVVGQASTSKHGPANRFVRLALKRAGWPQVGDAAMEQALERSPLTTSQE